MGKNVDDINDYLFNLYQFTYVNKSLALLFKFYTEVNNTKIFYHP